MNSLINSSTPSLPLLRRRVAQLAAPAIVFAAVFGLSLHGVAQAKPAANPAPDTLVLSNGDTLHGKFVSAVSGKVTFHSDPLGDISLGWDKIKELHTTAKMAVFDNRIKTNARRGKVQFASGAIDADSEAVVVRPDTGATIPPIPIKNAEFIMDQATLDKQLNHEPGFMTGWNGAATAGATLVAASENQYTVSGAVSLVRAVPTVPWLPARNRTSTDFSGSFGKITEPSYYTPATPPATGLTFVPAVTTKTAILHYDAERDQYFATRVYVLGQAAFDHNFAQDLALQQSYGGGVGWTIVKSSKQELDLKGTIQFERQSFLTGTTSTGANPDVNLIGSTLASTYQLHLKKFNYSQGLAFIPAFNDSSAYSANETNTFAFPAYKNLSFSFGTLDSYLNDPPQGATPPAKRNSFQFTMGLTYAIKSKY
jgi:hypothetical protein